MGVGESFKYWYDDVNEEVVVEGVSEWDMMDLRRQCRSRGLEEGGSAEALVSRLIDASTRLRREEDDEEEEERDGRDEDIDEEEAQEAEEERREEERRTQEDWDLEAELAAEIYGLAEAQPYSAADMLNAYDATVALPVAATSSSDTMYGWPPTQLDGMVDRDLDAELAAALFGSDEEQALFGIIRLGR